MGRVGEEGEAGADYGVSVKTAETGKWSEGYLPSLDVRTIAASSTPQSGVTSTASILSPVVTPRKALNVPTSVASG
jgi:hypothetical protein